jgi:hypothetical protein
MRRIVMLVFVLTVFSFYVYCQEAPVNPLEKGVVHNLTDDGKYAIKFGGSIELWARYAQFNPGTKDFSGKLIDNDFDFVLRRITSSTSVKLDRFLFFMAIGLGSQTMAASISPYTTTKPSIYFYDIFCSYEFVPQYLRIGYGLSLYKGLSRYASASATKTIGADVPMLASPDVITTEQTARHLGVFATGNAGLLSYRLIFGKPFVVNSTNRPNYGIGKAADVPNNNFSYEGYFALQFLDKENNTMPFVPGTYLGKKKIFNIGAGFYYHPHATLSISDAGDTVSHNERHFAADVFLELPVLDGGAFTFYTAVFKFNYGPNYSLNGGTANLYATTSPAGAGIAEPGFGTGNAISTQVAWMFPKVFGKMGKIQLYYEGDYRFYKALNDPALHHNIGINYFVFGHQLKFTLQEELRPYFINGNLDSHKGLTILKSQINF